MSELDFPNARDLRAGTDGADGPLVIDEATPAKTADEQWADLEAANTDDGDAPVEAAPPVDFGKPDAPNDDDLDDTKD